MIQKSVMNKIQLILISCILAAFISSCKEKVEEGGVRSAINGNINNQLKLSIDTVSFILDETSSGSSKSMQYVGWGEPSLVWFNKINHSIDVYGLNDSGIKERIQLKKEGPNGIGTGDVGLYFLNYDSLVVSNKMQLFLLNRQGEVLEKFKLDSKVLGGYPDFEISSRKPAVLHNKKLYVSVYPQKSAFKKDHLSSWLGFMEINLMTGEMKPFGQLPKYMQENILGFNYLDKSFVSDGRNLIVSYMGVKDVFEIPFSDLNKSTRVKIETKSFESAESMPKKGQSEFINYTKHYLLRSSFDALYFNDEYFLRVCQSGISDEELNRREWSKEKTLQFYNKDLMFVHELPLNSKYGNYLMTSPIPGGFLIKVKSDDEDQINFMRVKIN